MAERLQAARADENTEVIAVLPDGRAALAAHAAAASPATGRIQISIQEKTSLGGEVIQTGKLTLDTGRLAADAGGGPVPLTRLEFLLLKELASHAGRPVPRATLLAAVWGFDFDPGSNVVDVCVRRLRSKLGFGLIKTVRREGYQLVGATP